MGLARTFRDAIDSALGHGADIIVNTDADNHYDQSRIPDLIAPILAGRADIVVGSRDIATSPMKASHRWGNMRRLDDGAHARRHPGQHRRVQRLPRLRP